jgi:hypothetical protein
MCSSEDVLRFQIRFNLATKQWILQPDNHTIPCPLVFCSDGKGGGHMGLYRAICMAMSKGATEGGEIEILFCEGEAVTLRFDATGLPELATMEMGASAPQLPI